MAIDHLVLLVEDKVDREERLLLLFGADFFDLLLRVVNVLDLASAVDLGRDGQEPVNGIDVLLDRLAGRLEHGVLHEVFELHKELLQLANFVGLLVALGEVEPGALALGSLIVVLLDDLLDLGDPGLLQVVALLRDSRGLNLVELINRQSLIDVRVEYVTIGRLTALFVDLLLGSDNLLLDLQRLKAVL